jgi:large subunit ribosomal protein L3
VYPEGLLGKKMGMTQIFTPEGEVIPVTVIQVGPCFVLEVRKLETHGYSAVQLGFEPKKAQRVNRAMTGHFGKAGKGAFSHIKEMRCDVQTLGWTTQGQELKVGDVFKDGEFVDVSGTSIGRGFAGVVKRFKVAGTVATRGTHEYRRHIGAIGCRKFPGHVFKNKTMPGHMGNEAVTVKNLKVVQVKPEENLIFVRGGIPGAKGGLVVIRKASKGYPISAARV